MALNHMYNENYILACKVTSVDSPTSYSTALFTKKHIYVVAMHSIMENKAVVVNGKTGFEHLAEIVNGFTDEDAIHSKASLVTMNFEGITIEVGQLKDLNVKTSFFSKGIYILENIDTFKKFNRGITGGGKELYVKLTDFYKDFKPMNW